MSLSSGGQSTQKSSAHKEFSIKEYDKIKDRLFAVN
jgi:hypothetical protein